MKTLDEIKGKFLEDPFTLWKRSVMPYNTFKKPMKSKRYLNEHLYLIHQLWHQHEIQEIVSNPRRWGESYSQSPCHWTREMGDNALKNKNSLALWQPGHSWTTSAFENRHERAEPAKVQYVSTSSIGNGAWLRSAPLSRFHEYTLPSLMLGHCGRAKPETSQVLQHLLIVT